MSMLNILKKTIKVRGRSKLLPAALLTFLAVITFINTALAQKNNLSDWNVPPPLAPGNVTKGNATGKQGAGKPSLTVSDVPAAAQPGVSAVQLPFLAVISTTAPVVVTPKQPQFTNMTAGMADIPLPGAPGMPSMPQRTIQDAEEPASADLPVPNAPDLPVVPLEPSGGQAATTVQTEVIITPEVLGAVDLTLSSNAPFTPWSIPGLPENEGFKFIAPRVDNNRSGGKVKASGKSRSLKNK